MRRRTRDRLIDGVVLIIGILSAAVIVAMTLVSLAP
jgi:hypothetical protein